MASETALANGATNSATLDEIARGRSLMIMFIDGTSSHSERQIRALQTVATSFVDDIGFVAIVTFDATRGSCARLAQDLDFDVVMDRPDFFNGKWSHDAFHANADDVLLYGKDRRLFRVIYRQFMDLSSMTDRKYIYTSLEELTRANRDLALGNFLTSQFDEYSGYSMFGETLGEPVRGTDFQTCKAKCIQMAGCTGFSMWGSTECSFRSEEPMILKEIKVRSSPSTLYIRKAVDDVNARAQVLWGLFLGLGIIFCGVGLFMVCSRMGRSPYHGRSTHEGGLIHEAEMSNLPESNEAAQEAEQSFLEGIREEQEPAE